jgi:hypothetical protein
MNVIIAGGRDFTDFALLTRKCDSILRNVKHVKVIEGEAAGADKLGKKWAILRGHPYVAMPADWALNGKAAGPIRNEQMARIGEALIAFWDGKSRGTKDMIERAKAYEYKYIRVIKY